MIITGQFTIHIDANRMEIGIENEERKNEKKGEMKIKIETTRHAIEYA